MLFILGNRATQTHISRNTCIRMSYSVRIEIEVKRLNRQYSEMVKRLQKLNTTTTIKKAIFVFHKANVLRCAASHQVTLNCRTNTRSFHTYIETIRTHLYEVCSVRTRVCVWVLLLINVTRSCACIFIWYESVCVPVLATVDTSSRIRIRWTADCAVHMLVLVWFHTESHAIPFVLAARALLSPISVVKMLFCARAGNEMNRDREQRKWEASTYSELDRKKNKKDIYLFRIFEPFHRKIRWVLIAILVFIL